MKELVIISGKGGTGKTSITASLCALAKNKVIVDCDVDAADMHLLLQPEIKKSFDFYAGKQAGINQELCKKCGKCLEVCNFEAVKKTSNGKYVIDEISCEGCGTCYFNCPHQAIDFEQVKSGEWYESNTRFGQLIHAKLGIAEENSGKLVSTIRNHARILAHKNKNEIIIVDGSPGIGCPVIASISGANAVLVVTEPTISGIHDATRVLELAKHFKVSPFMCINKYDLNSELSNKIEEFCSENNVPLLGKIPYTKEFTEAMIKGITIIENSNNQASQEIKQIWEKISRILDKQ